MPIKIPAIKHDGSKGYLNFPDGTKPEEIQAKLTELNAVQEKSWGEHIKDWAITPPSWYKADQTFGERQMAVAKDMAGTVKKFLPDVNDPIGNLMMVSGVPLGGASGKAVVSKLVETGRPGLARLAGSVAGRMGVMTGAGAAGAAADQSDTAPSVGEGAFRGFLSGLVGEGAQGLLNAGSRILMRNAIRNYKNPDDAAKMLQRIMPEITGAGGDARETFRVLLGEQGSATKKKLIEDGLTAAAGKAQGQVVLPEMKAWLEAKGVPTKAGEGGIYQARDAMDDYMRMGPNVKGSGDRQYQAAMLTSLQKQLGKGAAGDFQALLGKNALYEEMFRLFDPAKTPGLYTPQGGLDFGKLQEKTFETFYGQSPASKGARARVGQHFDDMVQTVFRGQPAPFMTGDTPGGVSASIGMHYPRVHGVKTPQFAGAPYQLLPGTLDPAGAAAVNELFRHDGDGSPSVYERGVEKIQTSIPGS